MKVYSLFPVFSVDEKLFSVSPRVEGLVTSSIDCIDPMHTQTLKPSVLPDLASVGKLDEGLSFPELRNLGLTSPLKKPIGSSYFLRSCTKIPGNYPLSSNSRMGQGVSGCSDGHLMESDQSFDNGALRTVVSLDKVTL